MRIGRMLVGLGLVAAIAAAPAQARTTGRQVDRAIARAVSLGYPGVIVVIHRRGHDEVRTRGVADRASRRRWRAGDSMRNASVSKALEGAGVLGLVRDGALKLDDTVGALLPGVLPQAGAVTVAELMQHTGGVPDYTSQPAVAQALGTDPGARRTPLEIVGFVRDVPLDFPPGSRYRYSNTDNVLLELMVEKVTGLPYARVLRDRVTRPLGLRHTYLAGGLGLPRPFVHGYALDGRRYEDVSNYINPTFAAASGGVVSTARELGAFMRGLAAGRLTGRAMVARARAHTRPGNGSPPGPGVNRVGLSIFRYRLPCGAVVWGHSGTFPGYRQWAAADPPGRTSVVVSANAAAKAISPAADRALRHAQALAACRAVGR
jgi:D-alanyl-D-alanine carboxypeptidase